MIIGITSQDNPVLPASDVCVAKGTENRLVLLANPVPAAIRAHFLYRP